MAYITEVEIKGLWGYKHILWENVNKDVNIIVGINGSGKSTLLNLIRTQIQKGFKSKIEYSDILVKFADVDNVDNYNAEFISTFDTIPVKSSKTESPLTLELLNTIYTTGKGTNSFYDYRLKATNIPKQAKAINERIQLLYKIIDKQFSLTNKVIGIDLSTNKLIFKDDNQYIHLEDLSSGEKQFLLIIFKVFLMEGKPAILLMDEPEISLHIDWQYELVNIIRQLNPNCQLIISTHSPSVFGDGWGDKVVYMENIKIESNANKSL